MRLLVISSLISFKFRDCSVSTGLFEIVFVSNLIFSLFGKSLLTDSASDVLFEFCNNSGANLIFFCALIFCKRVLLFDTAFLIAQNWMKNN